MIVLGVDGMDPAFVERHWDVLPNLRKLRDEGQFSRLQTTTPPQSPVAWSTFITGLPPAQHGIFDFVHRDPKTLQPFSSLSRIEEPRFHLPLFGYELQLSSAKIVSLRKGSPFWKGLSDHGVPVTIMRMPTNYPPEKAGLAIAGMGVPDLGGTLGTFTLFTDDPEEYSRAVPGGRFVKVTLQAGHAVLPVEGPPNTFRKNRQVVSTDLNVDIDSTEKVARFSLGDTLAVLRESEWSAWLPVKFPLFRYLQIPGGTVSGAIRVYVKQLHPRLAIYVSPVNVDPIAPALPVSYPAAWSGDVAREIGRFYTQGIPEDTSALRQNALTMTQFEQQLGLVAAEEHRLLLYSLRHFDRGLLFLYLSSIDQSSHIFWGRHEAELLDVYRTVDRLIGEVSRAFPDAELIVMSDHGFTSFDRAVHLNTWLEHRGFLTLSARPSATDTTLENVDWASTEAYAIGLNGLYLNMKDREAHGTIQPGQQRSALIANLREQLIAWRDPVNGRQVVEVAADPSASSSNANVAPDLIVGYARGYRGSWQTALGGIPDSEIIDNDDLWIGDHCVNPAGVPGVFFINRKGNWKVYGLQDVTSLILRRFGEAQ